MEEAARVLADDLSHVVLADAALEELLRYEEEDLVNALAAGPAPLIEDAAVVGTDSDPLPVAHLTEADDVLKVDFGVVVEGTRRAGADDATAHDDALHHLPGDAPLAVAVGDELIRDSLVPDATVGVAHPAADDARLVDGLGHGLVAHVSEVHPPAADGHEHEDQVCPELAQAVEAPTGQVAAVADGVALVVDGVGAADTEAVVELDLVRDLFVGLVARPALPALDREVEVPAHSPTLGELLRHELVAYHARDVQELAGVVLVVTGLRGAGPVLDRLDE